MNVKNVILFVKVVISNLINAINAIIIYIILAIIVYAIVDIILMNKIYNVKNVILYAVNVKIKQHNAPNVQIILP